MPIVRIKAVETDGHPENIGMNVPQMIAAATPLGTSLATASQAQLLTHRHLSYPMASTIAAAAIESCGAKGYPVSAVVVDRAGEVIVAMRGRGGSAHHGERAPQGLHGAELLRADFGLRAALRRQ